MKTDRDVLIAVGLREAEKDGLWVRGIATDDAVAVVEYDAIAKTWRIAHVFQRRGTGKSAKRECINEAWEFMSKVQGALVWMDGWNRAHGQDREAGR